MYLHKLLRGTVYSSHVYVATLYDVAKESLNSLAKSPFLVMMLLCL